MWDLVCGLFLLGWTIFGSLISLLWELPRDRHIGRAMRWLSLYLSSFMLGYASIGLVLLIVPLYFVWLFSVIGMDRAQLLLRTLLEIAIVCCAVCYGGEALVDKYNWTWSSILAFGIFAVVVLVTTYFAEAKELPEDCIEELPEDLPPQAVELQETVDSVLREIDGMTGLAPVKEELRRLVASIRIQKARENAGLKGGGVSYHCVFTGNPGTGKTTIARAMAKIYHALGILATDKFVETERSGLVAKYVGQTALKTNNVIDSALDGVLFIDEAYTLAGKYEKDFGHEAIDTLLKRMEDDRKRIVVIVAGYTAEMERFINDNPGLSSRFTRYIDFPDYSPSELLQIFKSLLDKGQYVCSAKAEAEFLNWMEEAVSRRDNTFGNGRFVRNCFEKITEQQALRLDKANKLSRKQLKELTVADVRAARPLVKV